MGNYVEKESELPRKGMKVVGNHTGTKNLNLFTDYIVSPLTTPAHLRVFSVLDYSYRKEWVQDKTKLKLTLCTVSDCILRVTRVFQNSPCESAGIRPNEYIVGSLQGQYTCLRTFVAMLHKLMTQTLTNINFGVCSIDGSTRMVTITTASLQEWLGANKNNKGILGCELAEGWMHKFKPKINTEQPKDKVIVANQSPFPSQIKTQASVAIDVNNDVEHKTAKLDGMVQQSDGKLIRTIQYRGVLKSSSTSQELSICQCINQSKTCEQCYLSTPTDYVFYNKKTNKTISISKAMLFD